MSEQMSYDDYGYDIEHLEDGHSWAGVSTPRLVILEQVIAHPPTRSGILESQCDALQFGPDETTRGDLRRCY